MDLYCLECFLPSMEINRSSPLMLEAEIVQMENFKDQEGNGEFIKGKEMLTSLQVEELENSIGRRSLDNNEDDLQLPNGVSGPVPTFVLPGELKQFVVSMMFDNQ